MSLVRRSSGLRVQPLIKSLLGGYTATLSPVGSCKLLILAVPPRPIFAIQTVNFSGSLLDEEDDFDENGVSSSSSRKKKLYNAAEVNKKYAVDGFGDPYPKEHVITPVSFV